MYYYSFLKYIKCIKVHLPKRFKLALKKAYKNMKEILNFAKVSILKKIDLLFLRLSFFMKIKSI